MRKVVLFHAAIFFASCLFVYFCSTSTSPRYEFLGDDSSIFQAVGKGWAEGRLPYVDLFENKGALIFLIDALGYMITPRVGIMFLQIPAMYVTFLFAWRSLGIYLSGKAKFVAAVFMIVFYGIYYGDGNRTEEWSMPFLMASTYFFLRGLKEEKFSCSPHVGFIYGLGFGACVLLRMMNAAPICCYAVLSAIFLLKAGDFKTLRKNFLNFCAGTVTIILPFIVYFAAHSALYEFFYGTILLNVLYSAQRGNFLLTHLGEYTAYITINFMPLYAMILIGAVEFAINKTRAALSSIICGAAMLLLMFKLSPYFGYCALNAALLPLLFAVLNEFAGNFRTMWSDKKFSFKRLLCKALIAVLMIYPLFLTEVFFSNLIKINSEKNLQRNLTENKEILRLSKIIPPDEKNSVMIWSEGLHVSHWILTTGIYPRCRFFGNVKAFAEADPNVKVEWLTKARSNPPQWIIYCAHKTEFSGEKVGNWVKNFRRNRDLDVEKFLHENYKLAAETEIYQDFFRLYRLSRADIVEKKTSF